MAYAIIQPPFTLEFREMSRAELKAYGEWFHRVLLDRVAELAGAVKSAGGFEGWEPDRSVESLDVLGRWFEGRVATRAKTEEELEEQRAALVFPIDLPTVQLTNETFSLAMDVGMYFACVVLETLPGTRWDQVPSGKRNAHYGHPVILGFGKVELDPVHVLVMTAYGVSRGKPAELRKLCDTWAKMRG